LPPGCKRAPPTEASVRFLVAGGSPGNLETYYAERAVRVRKGELKTAAELIQSMTSDVPNDAQFRAAFATETASAEHLARYYLACLELAEIGETNPHLTTNDETIGSLEHVLPKSPNTSVWKMSDEEIERLRNRIGNLALLSPSDNSNRGNDSFKAAKAYYAKSQFTLTKALAKYGDEWDEESIADRQEKLAELAIRAWPV
jgi:hypothetical protein